jgi:hypothetical protein
VPSPGASEGDEVARSFGAGVRALAVAGVLGLTPGFTGPGVSAAGDPHCVVSLATGDMQCFPTFRLAIAYATGGRITDAPEAESAADIDSAFVARVDALVPDGRADDVLIGTAWWDRDFGGRSVNFTATSGCDANADRDWLDNYVGDDWNDKISSMHSYSNCWMTGHEDSMLRGRTVTSGRSSGVPHMNHMSDRVSSLDWG